jgi:CubicO group peptidase (beta-lactamase class C family)
MSDHREDLWDRLGEFVAQQMERWNIPGVSVGVLAEGKVTTGGFGVTHVDHPLPVTDDALFQIGSITKTFVGTAIMRLVEGGKLDLDATVRTYVPSFQVSDEEASAGATLRHLLTHTGGWAGDYFHATGAGDDALARYVADMADLPQLAPLGSLWSYNNAGFSVAGRILESVTGSSFEAVLREQVLDPLGLEHSFFEAGDVLTHRFVVGHRVTEEGVEVARPWPLERSSNPQGGIICSAKDLLRYARFQLGDGTAQDGTRLLSRESLAQMHSPLVTLWGDEAWGLAWSVAEVQGVREVSHGGGTNGQITLMGLLPERRFAFAVLTNADRGGTLTQAVRRWILKHYLDLDAPRPHPIEASEEELAQYAGCYQGFYSDLELGMLGGRLVGQVTPKRGFPSEEVPPLPPPPPMSVALCEKDRLLVLDGRFKDAVGDVILREDGSIGWLRISRRLHLRTS